MPFSDPLGPRRVLLVGWDGACWELLDPLLAAGRLPNLSALIEEGFRAPLQSTVPPVTPPAWSAMALGLGPGRSGILGFRDFDFSKPSGFAPRLTSSADLAGRTLFEHLASQGESLSLVGWPMTWPPLPISGSVVVAGWPRPHSSTVPVWPRAWARKLGQWGDEAPRRAIGRPSLEEQIAEASWWDRRHAEIASKLLRERDDGLVAVVFSGTDHLSHSLWGDPRLAEHFERVDAHLGALRRAAGAGVATVLVSDHGFGPSPKHVFHLGRWLEGKGLLKLREGAAPGPLGRSLGRLRHALPARHWQRLRDRLPPRLRNWGHAQASEAGRIDASSTRAYRISLYESWEGVVCPSLDARERTGLVRSLSDLESVRRVHRAEDVFAGAAPGTVPELVVEFEEDVRGGEGLGPGPLLTPVPEEELLRKPASHRREGVLVAGGPGLIPDRPPREANVVDVGCNALALAGATLPDDRDGRVWLESLSLAVRYEATPMTDRKGRAPSAHSPAVSAGERAARSELEVRLEELGYV